MRLGDASLGSAWSQNLTASSFASVFTLLCSAATPQYFYIGCMVDIGSRPEVEDPEAKRLKLAAMAGENSNDAKLVEAVGGLEELLSRQTSRFVDQTTVGNRKFMEDFLEKADQNAKKMLDVSNEVLRAELRTMESGLLARVTAAEAKAEAARTAAASASESRPAGAASTAAPSLGGYSIRGGQSTYGAPFEPRYVELKGWVSNWDLKDEQMLDFEEVWPTVIGALIHLPGDVRSCIDVPASVTANSKVMVAKILLKVDGGRQGCGRVSRALRQVVTDGELMLGGIAPRVAIEAEPAKRPMIAAGAKAMNTLERLGISKAHMSAPEWMPFKWWAKQKSTGEVLKPKRLLLSWSEAQGYQVVEETLNLVKPGMTVRTVLDALA